MFEQPDNLHNDKAESDLSFSRFSTPELRSIGGVLGVSALLHIAALVAVFLTPAPVDAPRPLQAALRPAHVQIEYFRAAPEPEQAEAEPEPEPEPQEEIAEPEAEVIPPPRRHRERPVQEVAELAPPEVIDEVEAEEAAPLAAQQQELPVEAPAATPPTVNELASNMATIGSSDDGPTVARHGTGGSRVGAVPVAQEGSPDGTRVHGEANGRPEGDNLSGVRSHYRRNLEQRLAQLHNNYSPVLRRLMLEGTVTLRIFLDNSGQIVDVGVVRSSGDNRLDEYAAAQVRQLRRLVTPPPELGAEARTVELPISYSLRG